MVALFVVGKVVDGLVVVVVVILVDKRNLSLMFGQNLVTNSK